MGIIALAGLLAYLAVGLVCIAAVIRSAQRASSIPLYWTVAAVAALSFPMLVQRTPPHVPGGDYAGLAYLLEGALSLSNVVCFIGGLVCLIGSFGKSIFDKVLSGASWGFMSAYGVHLVVVVIG